MRFHTSEWGVWTQNGLPLFQEVDGPHSVQFRLFVQQPLIS